MVKPTEHWAYHEQIAAVASGAHLPIHFAVMGQNARLLGEYAAGDHTQQACYAVTFSSDGSRLLAGSGQYYGGGSILFLRPDGLGIVNRVSLAELLPDAGEQLDLVSVSGLCFDGYDRFLAVSLWLHEHQYYPGLLFRIENDDLVPFMSGLDGRGVTEKLNINNRGYATGVRLHDQKLIVRCSSPENEMTLTAFPVPSDVATRGIDHSLTSSRMAIIKGTAVTGKEESLLVSGPGEAGTASSELVSSPHEGGVSAMVAHPHGSQLITGGKDGTIAFWNVIAEENGSPLVKLATLRPFDALPDGCGDTPAGTHLYSGASIVGMCFMHDAQHLVMVYASGYVRIWKGEEIVLEWMLPAGSPRSVAAHPSEPLLAIGCKGPGQVWVYQVDVQRQSG